MSSFSHQDLITTAFAASLTGRTSHPNEDRHVLSQSFQDYFLLHPEHISSLNLSNASAFEQMQLYAVIDGHGGSGCADFIHAVLTEKIVYFWSLCGLLENISDSLCDVLENSLASIEQEFAEHAKVVVDHSGACVVAAIYLDGWLCVSNIGDAGAVLFDNFGNELRMSQLHSHRNKQELRRIEKAGGRISNGYIERCLQPSRTIGDCWIKERFPGVIIAEPDSCVIELINPHKGCYSGLVLASDGLWDIGYRKASLFIRQHTATWSKCV